MNLAEFVKETLVQISNGVKEAQSSVRADGGYVNPVARISSSKRVIVNSGVQAFDQAAT